MKLQEGTYIFEDKKDMAYFLELALEDDEENGHPSAKFNSMAKVARAIGNKEVEDWARKLGEYIAGHLDFEVSQENIEQKVRELGFSVKNGKVKVLSKLNSKKPSESVISVVRRPVFA
jgi:hypothetical protein